LEQLIERLESRQLLAAQALATLADINQTTKPSEPHASAVLPGGDVVVVAESAATGRELFVANASGARLFADVVPGAVGANPRDVVVLGNRAIFWATETPSTLRLWASDGTPAGTVSLNVTRPTTGSTTSIVVLNGRAYAVGIAGGLSGIVGTDGTPSGTSTLANIGLIPWALKAHAGALVYGTNSGGQAVWRVDTTGVTTRLTPTGANVTGFLFSLGDKLLFTANNDPWVSDGTPAGTARAADLLGTSDATVQDAARLDNGRIIFTVGPWSNVFALNPDGTTVGPLYDSTSGEPSEIVAIGNKAYFGGVGASYPQSGLYETDGTFAGTRLVKTMGVTTGSFVMVPSHLTRMGSKLLFTGNEGVNGWELWTSDGTTAGTTLLKDIYPGSTASLPHATPNTIYDGEGISFLQSGGRAYLAATTPTHGSELWSSDGTAAGTYLTADINSATNSSIWATQPTSSGFFATPQGGVDYNGKTYFTADDGVNGRELWVTDGTAAGTRLAFDVNPGTAASEPTSLLAHNGLLYFVATVGSGGRGLYRYDGTTAVRLTSTAQGAFSVRGAAEPQALFVFKNKVAFLGFQNTFGQPVGTALWMSDGTNAGTSRVGDLISTSSGDPTNLTLSGNYLYFRASVSNVNRLCRHDGVNWAAVGGETGTVRFVDLNGTLISVGASGVWATDASGTRALGGPDGVYDMVRLGNRVYVSGTMTTAPYGYGRWRTDGTAAGTVSVVGTAAAPWDYPLFLMRVAGGRIWGFAEGAGSGIEPWVSDGTASGTRMLVDLNPGAAASYVSGYPGPAHEPYFIDGPGGYAYFQATTAANGTELFRTDGTTAGTRLVFDLVPGPGDSLPGPFMRVGTELFVAVDDPAIGREYRRLRADIDAPSVVSKHWPLQPNETFRVLFTEDISASLAPADVCVTHLSSGRVLDPSEWTLTESAAGVATTLRVSLTSPAPADGEYEIRVLAADVKDAAGNGLDADVVTRFFLSNGVAGAGADDVRVRRAGTQLLIDTGAQTFPVLLATLDAALISGGGGDDTITLDLSTAGTALAAGTIRIEGGTGNDRVSVLGSVGADNLHFSATTIGDIGTDVSHNGVESFAADGNGGWDTVTVQAGPELTFGRSQQLGSLSVGDGGRVAVATGTGAMTFRALMLASDAQLDITNNAIAIDYATGATTPLGSWNGTAYTGILGLLAKGRAHNGVGLFTSIPDASAGLTDLGVAEASDVLGLAPGQTATWSGQAVDATTVIVKYTYAGDANLDGQVTGDDYSAIDFSILVPDSFGWSAGDFNFDGVISGDDYAAIDFAILAQSTPL
jgi:ELWxxDGT repeat protein